MFLCSFIHSYHFIPFHVADYDDDGEDDGDDDDDDDAIIIFLLLYFIIFHLFIFFPGAFTF